MVLQKMRAGAQGIAAKILVGLIVFVLAVFGFGAFDLFSATEPIAATVNGDEITERELEVQTARLRSQYGPDVAPEVLDSLVAPSDVLEQMISRALLGQAAEDLGLSISDDAVAERVRDLFQGDEAAFRQQLAAQGFTPTSFQSALASDEVLAQFGAALRDTAFATNREISRAAQVQGQTRDIAYLLFDAGVLAADVTIEESAIETHYGDYLDDYMTEEQFDFDFVRLPRASLEAEVEVDEEAVRAAFEDELAALQPRRHAAHILLEVDEERSLAEATQTLLVVREELLAGTASFEERARELSEDAGSAPGGGDLGPTGKGVFVPPFEEALWALSPGELSQPVESQFGVHLIKLIAIEEPEAPAFEERREEIAADLRRADVATRFTEAVRQMDEIAFENGDSLEPLVAEFGLAIETLDGATRSSRSDLFAERDVRDAWLSPEVILEGFNSRAVETGLNDAVVARLRERHPATERPLDEVREEIRAKLAHEQGEALAEAAAVDALAGIEDGETPAALAERTEIEWQRADAVSFDRPDPSLPRELVDAAFEMPTPPAEERESAIATLADGSRALVLLSNVALGDYSAMSDADRTRIADTQQRLDAGRDFDSLLETLRNDAAIDAITFETDPQD